VPPSGQAWTSLAKLQSTHQNTFHQDEEDSRVWSIVTEPKFAIGQRCVLLRTPRGNVLWDCITLLDSSTVERIREMGGLKAIVISHPHYYTTHLDWAKEFGCPVYLAEEDVEWCCREDVDGRRKLIAQTTEQLEEVKGEEVVMAKPGGHFPGSLVLCWDKKLFIADTMVTTPVRLPPHSTPLVNIDIQTVCLLLYRPATRNHKFCIYVVHPKHDTFATF
jgi:glyoxylase-like metal-dependent hydrolase (beta-lactamase superfamily II)